MSTLVPLVLPVVGAEQHHAAVLAASAPDGPAHRQLAASGVCDRDLD